MTSRSAAPAVGVATVVFLGACVPPGVPHGPRIQEGTHVGVTVGNFVADGESAFIPALSVRFASENRQAGRRGQQFTLTAPLPYLAEAIDDSPILGPLLLLVGDYYRETDHPNSGRVPRGWGIQVSLAHIAPYAKIGWYDERGGVFLTNGFGIYAGEEFLPPAGFAWWPTVGLEVRPWERLTTSFYLGAGVLVETGEWDPSYELQLGASVSGKLFD